MARDGKLHTFVALNFGKRVCTVTAYDEAHARRMLVKPVEEMIPEREYFARQEARRQGRVAGR